jgi:hypothetical protein
VDGARPERTGRTLGIFVTPRLTLQWLLGPLARLDLDEPPHGSVAVTLTGAAHRRQAVEAAESPLSRSAHCLSECDTIQYV